MNRDWRAVAWDIDGTLIDSEPLHKRALLAVCENYISNIEEIEAESFIGTHMHDVWQILNSKFPSTLTREQWLNEIEAHYISHIKQANPAPNARTVIQHIYKTGILQIFVSNSSRSIVNGNLDRIGIRDFGLPSISLDDTPHGKPDPAPYLQACKLLGVMPSQCLAVEDTLTGCYSANSAGLFTIMIKQQREIGDQAVSHQIDQLEEVLFLLNNKCDLPPFCMPT